MKKIIITAAVLMVFIVFSGVSFSQPPAEDTPGFIAEDKEIPPGNFEELKSLILKRIDDRMKRLQDEKTCVEVAKNSEELKKCKPERPGGPGRWKSQQQPMKQQP